MTPVITFPMTDAQVDEALHEIGRHLGVRYDARGEALADEPRVPMISAGESVRLLERDVRELNRRKAALDALKRR
jgi:hypothetical protein